MRIRSVHSLENNPANLPVKNAELLEKKDHFIVNLRSALTSFGQHLYMLSEIPAIPCVRIRPKHTHAPIAYQRIAY